MDNCPEGGLLSTDVIQYKPQRLSPMTVLSLLSDDLQYGGLRATIGIKFLDEDSSAGGTFAGIHE